MKVFVIISLDLLMKIKVNLFYKHEHEIKNNFFSNNTLKFQPRT